MLLLFYGEFKFVQLVRSINTLMKTKICYECKHDLPKTEYHSNGTSSSGKPRLKPRCKKCNSIYEATVFFEKMYRAIGGKENLKCALCGYDKCVGALEFHHIDPNEKDRELSRMRNYSYERIKKEIDKCVILCGCCHPEVHAGLRSI